MRRMLNIKFKMPKGFNVPIQASVLMLMLLGILMVTSANMSTRYNSSASTLLFSGGKEFGFCIIGYFLMVNFAVKFDIKKFRKYFHLILFLLIVSLLITRVPGIGGGVNGAYAWIRLGPMTLQPSEFAKVFVILMIALYLGDKYKRRIDNPWQLWQYPLAIIIIIAGIITVYQNDFGSAIVLLGISYVCFLIPDHKKTYKVQKWLIGLLALGLFMMWFVSSETGLQIVEKIFGGYQLRRFHSAADPFENRFGSSYQIYHSLVAFVRGGITGVGYGNGFIKLSYLPEAATDGILAVIVEELGMIGFGFVLLCYAIIIGQLTKYALKVKSEKDKIILYGTVTYLTIHYIFNIGGITGFIPLTGVPLLFLSAGGSSKLAILILIGICQNVISRHNRRMMIQSESH